MFRLALNSGYTASQERITVVSRRLPVLYYQDKCNTKTVQQTLRCSCNLSAGFGEKWPYEEGEKVEKIMIRVEVFTSSSELA